jgi:hypothetical protein
LGGGVTGDPDNAQPVEHKAVRQFSTAVCLYGVDFMRGETSTLRASCIGVGVPHMADIGSKAQSSDGPLPGGAIPPERTLAFRIATLQSQTRRRGQRLRVLAAISAVGGVATSSYLIWVVPSTVPVGGAVAIGVLAAAGFTAYAWFFMTVFGSGIQRELDEALARQAVLSQLPGDEKSTYFESLVSINVTNLAAYYSLVKEHTDNSFRVSVIAGIVGFILIVGGLTLGLMASPNTQFVAYLAAGSGVVVEFITGVFFYLYNRTVQQLKEYHDSLISAQNVLLALKLIGDTIDATEKAKLVAQVLGVLVMPVQVKAKT